jgi:hypothetical protein
MPLYPENKNKKVPQQDPGIVKNSILKSGRDITVY